MAFKPKPEMRREPLVVTARLQPTDAARFEQACKQYDLKPGTLARQMIIHCLSEMDMVWGPIRQPKEGD